MPGRPTSSGQRLPPPRDHDRVADRGRARCSRYLRRRVEKLMEEILESARTDVQTGLLNGRGLAERLGSELERARMGAHRVASSSSQISGLVDYRGKRGDSAADAITTEIAPAARRVDPPHRHGRPDRARPSSRSRCRRPTRTRPFCSPSRCSPGCGAPTASRRRPARQAASASPRSPSTPPSAEALRAVGDRGLRRRGGARRRPRRRLQRRARGRARGGPVARPRRAPHPPQHRAEPGRGARPPRRPHRERTR